ncbi:putative Ig domain-containing protein [Arenimonas aestuarii]
MQTTSFRGARAVFARASVQLLRVGLLLLASLAVASPALAQVMTITGSTPTTYSGAGQSITFNFTFGQSNRITTSISLETMNVELTGFSCAGLPLAVFGSTTCTGTYTTTSSDVSTIFQYGTFSSLDPNGIPSGGSIAGQVQVAYVPAAATPSASITVSPAQVAEDGATNLVYTVTLSDPAPSNLSIALSYGGTATPGSDYTGNTASLAIASGASSGSVTINPTADGTAEANETVTVSLGAGSGYTLGSPSSATGTLLNDDVVIAVSPTTLASGTVASPYSQALAAAGGSAPYTFSLISGSLPPGMSLSAAGLLSGTPTAGGSFAFTVSATDNGVFPGPYSGSRTYALTISAPTMSLSPSALPGGTLGQAYFGGVNASGGILPYTYAVTAGALPGGLIVNASSGAISGTPTAPGTFNFTLTATDSSTGTGPYAGSGAYAITVTDVAPVATASSLTVPYDSAPANVPLTLSGGTPTSLAITTPAANGTATVSGTTISYQPTPGYAGADSFSYTATNSGGTSAAAVVSVQVSDPVATISAGGALTTTASTLYTETFTFNGGAQPWSGYQVNGLPAGLSITAASANTVTISGTPGAVGTFNLAVSGTDSSTGNGPFVVGDTFALTVAPPVLALDPAAGTLNATYGSAFSQAFSASGGSGSYGYSLSGTLPAGLALVGDTLSGTPVEPGSFPITITATDTGVSGVGAPFSVSTSYTLDVPAPGIVLDPATLPDADAGIAYSQALSASGGVAPHTFSISGGSLPTGLALAANGALTGTATQAGNFAVDVTATDAFGQTGTRSYALVVAAPTLVMTPTTGVLDLPYGAAYSQAFTASGGSGSFSYALTGTLPAGLSFVGNTLSGTPTAPGSYPISVGATDTGLSGTGAPFTVAVNYTLDVPAPAITITPATLPDAIAGQAYPAALSASGGVGPHAFTVSSGNLPPGLSLATSGAISGTPTSSGSFNVTVTATDANGQTGDQAYTLVVAPPLLDMTPAAGTLNAPYAVAYSQAFTASGGSGSFSYALTGTLPAGLSFVGNTLSGTPTAPGSYPITVTATDTGLGGTGAPFTVVVNYTLDVPAPAITITPATLPDAIAGQAYAAALSASGGVGPHAFTVSSGSLPPGLSLASSGEISGTPTSSGSFNATLTATDANGQVGTQAYALLVAVPNLDLQPASLPGGTVGIGYAATLSTSGGIAPYQYAVTAGSLPDGLALGTGGQLTGTPTATGSFGFTVTVTDSTAGTPASLDRAYVVDIVEAPPEVADDVATVLAGETVSIAVTANDTSLTPITGISLASLPADGTATVAGLEIEYTAPAQGVSSASFTYVATGAGGTSAPATVRVTVNPLPMPVAQAVSTAPATPVTVDITAGASGGPFTAADILTISPATAGTATLAPGGQGFLLTFTPDPAFTGVATIEFTVDNAFATSDVTVLEVTVQERPDPSQDPDVVGMIDAQANSARRFALAQVANFHQRLEQLHRGGGGSQANLAFAADRRCEQPLVGHLPDACSQAFGLGGGADTGANNGDGYATPAAGDDATGRFGSWIGGMIRSGKLDASPGRAGLDFESDGLSAGLDYRVTEDFVIGAGLGWGQDEVEVGNDGSRVEGSARTLAAYASWHPGRHFFLDGVLGLQDLRFDLRRYLVATNGFVTGRRDGDQWFASVTAGSEIDRDGMLIAPYLRYDTAHASLDRYVESGHPLLALAYAPMDVDTSVATLGLRMDWRRARSWGSFTPQLRLEYQQDLSGRSLAELGYADLPGGPVYGVAASRFDRNRFVAGLGAMFDTNTGWNWRVEYRGQLGGDGEDHGVQVNVQKQF